MDRDLVHKELAYEIIGAAMEVHRHLGPGYLEAVYHKALMVELTHRKLPYACEAPIELTYRGEKVGEYRLDLVVDQKVIVELKAVHHLDLIHIAQTINYLKASRLQLALLINFGDISLKFNRYVQTDVDDADRHYRPAPRKV